MDSEPNTPLSDAAAPQHPRDIWHAQFMAAVSETFPRTPDNQDVYDADPLGFYAEALCNAIGQKPNTANIDILIAWLNKETVPSRDNFKPVLRMLDIDEDAAKALEEARAAAERAPRSHAERVGKKPGVKPPHDPKVVSGKVGGNLGVGGLTYKELPGVLVNTTEPWDFLHAERLLRGETREIAANMAGVLETTWLNWEVTASLPDIDSRAKLPRYFGNRQMPDGTLKIDRFLKLVADKRLHYMAKALSLGNRSIFSAHLVHAGAEERIAILTDYLKHPADARAEKGRLVASPGIYMTLLRTILGKKHEECDVVENLHHYAPNSLGNLEMDDPNMSIKSKVAYMDYLEGEVAKRDAALTAQERAAGQPTSEKLSDYFKPDKSHRNAVMKRTFPRAIGPKSDGVGGLG